jgi:DMSO/TMAO reductase YedYZ molybdopterin-dependent catalytic subunit
MSIPIVGSEPNIGLIIREHDPLNLEYPFDQLDEFLTPNDLFYIRSHFKAPVLDRHGYKLSIYGAVKTPFKISYEELLAMSSVTKPATLECAGNGRIFLVPQVKGAQWQLGAVSTANWTGVPLTGLLEKAVVDPNACEILFEAGDTGAPKEEPIPPGEIRYACSLAIAKANDVIIAYQMNGEEIPVDHGFPLRAIVPGHYGMASVKWLSGIRILTEPFNGYWQTSDYGYWDYDENNNPMRRALGQMALKSAGHVSLFPPGRAIASLVLRGAAIPSLSRLSFLQTTARHGSRSPSSMRRSLSYGGAGNLTGRSLLRREPTF